MSEPRPQRYLILTCDSEALPNEAPENHIDRLIWGRVPGAPYEAGIGKMMDIAEACGAKMTFFHDVFEQLHYGDETARAARHILERGHDLQMHLHIEFLPAKFWTRLGCLKVTWAMNLFNAQAARHVLEYGMELFEGMAGFRPKAYRAGAFRYNMAILQALGELGVVMSFQYNPSTTKLDRFPHGFDAGILPVFRWSNGLIEVPLGMDENLPPRKALPRYKVFELRELASHQVARRMMDHMWARGPAYNVMVLLLHSWSLLARNDSGHFDWQDDRLVRLFHDLLATLPADVKVVTASQLWEEIQRGAVQPAFEMPLPVAGTEMIPLFPLPPAQPGVTAPKDALTIPPPAEPAQQNQTGT